MLYIPFWAEIVTGTVTLMHILAVVQGVRIATSVRVEKCIVYFETDYLQELEFEGSYLGDIEIS